MAIVNETPTLHGSLLPVQGLSGTLVTGTQTFLGVIDKVETAFVADYTVLENKPQIEGVTLEGNKTFPELHLNSMSNIEIENLLV